MSLVLGMLPYSKHHACGGVSNAQFPSSAWDYFKFSTSTWSAVGDTHLSESVCHANGSRHDAPQEASKGDDVCPVHLVPQHSADWGAQRLRRT